MREKALVQRQELFRSGRRFLVFLTKQVRETMIYLISGDKIPLSLGKHLSPFLSGRRWSNPTWGRIWLSTLWERMLLLFLNIKQRNTSLSKRMILTKPSSQKKLVSLNTSKVRLETRPLLTLTPTPTLTPLLLRRRGREVVLIRNPSPSSTLHIRASSLLEASFLQIKGLTMLRKKKWCDR